MSLEVIGWSESRAGNGLAGIAAAPGETGFATSGDTITLPDAGLLIEAIAASGANVDEAALNGACFANKVFGFKAGSNALTTYPGYYRPRFPVPVHGVLTGYQDNANNNEDSGIVAVLKGPGGFSMPGVREVGKFKVDGAQTATANTWTAIAGGVSLPTDWDTSTDWYILDLRVAGATMQAFRVPPPFGNSRYGGAGWFASTAATSMYGQGPSEIFGKVPKGQTSFPLQILCADADTAQEIDVLLGR